MFRSFRAVGQQPRIPGPFSLFRRPSVWLVAFCFVLIGATFPSSSQPSHRSTTQPSSSSFYCSSTSSIEVSNGAVQLLFDNTTFGLCNMKHVPTNTTFLDTKHYSLDNPQDPTLVLPPLLWQATFTDKLGSTIVVDNTSPSVVSFRIDNNNDTDMRASSSNGYNKNANSDVRQRFTSRRSTLSDSPRLVDVPTASVVATLTWSDIAIGNDANRVDVVVTATLPPNSGLVTWDIALNTTRLTNTSLWTLSFPYVCNIGPTSTPSSVQSSPQLVIPGVWGSIQSASSGFSSIYPQGGTLSMQWLAYLTPETGAGIYMATHDNRATSKEFVWVGDQYTGVFTNHVPTGSFNVVHYPETMGNLSSDYSPSYSVTFGAFSGDWYDASMIYRDWLFPNDTNTGNSKSHDNINSNTNTNGPPPPWWVKKGPIRSRPFKDLDRFLNVSLWINPSYDLNDDALGDPAAVVNLTGTLLHLLENAYADHPTNPSSSLRLETRGSGASDPTTIEYGSVDAPRRPGFSFSDSPHTPSPFSIGVHWYSWNVWPWSTNLPESFPPKTNFTEAVKALHSMGAFVMPYLNGRLWDMNAPSYKPSGADSNHVKTSAQRLFPNTLQSTIESYAGQNFVVMCPYTSLWQGTIASLADTLFTQGMVDAVYIDQAGARPAGLCSDPSHHHTSGGGSYWVDGYEAMFEQIGSASSISSSSSSPSTAHQNLATTEDAAETSISGVAGMLFWNSFGGDLIPIWSSVYGGYVMSFGRSFSSADFEGSNASSTSSSYCAKIGEMFVFGASLGWFNQIEELKANPFMVHYTITLMKYRTYAKEYLLFGRTLRPLPTDTLGRGSTGSGKGDGSGNSTDASAKFLWNGKTTVIPLLLMQVWRTQNQTTGTVSGTNDTYTVAVIATNHSPSLSQLLNVTVDLERYGLLLDERGCVDVFRTDAVGNRHHHDSVRGVREVTYQRLMPPLSAELLEIASCA